MDSPAGKYCKECEPDKGCKIYNHAPKRCLEFNCAYSQMERVSTDLRPDNCDVIFEKITEDVFIGTMDPDVKRLKPVVSGQIEAFRNDGFSIVLFNQKISEPLIIPADGHTREEVWNKVKEERKKLDARTT